MSTEQSAIELLQEAAVRVALFHDDPLGFQDFADGWLDRVETYLRSLDATPPAGGEGWRVDEYGLMGETDLWTDGTQTIEVPKSLTRIIEDALNASAPAAANTQRLLEEVHMLLYAGHSTEAQRRIGYELDRRAALGSEVQS